MIQLQGIYFDFIRGQDKGNAFQTELPVFDSQPCRTWHGHTADVLDIAWSSASELILSASLDKTVRLWTVSQDACLREIQHQTWVTSVRFHPQDPSKFISGIVLARKMSAQCISSKKVGSQAHSLQNLVNMCIEFRVHLCFPHYLEKILLRVDYEISRG